MTSKKSYHHGDLKAQLVIAGLDIIRDSGIQGLSLRKLADKVGVSRTAPYHHFTNKNDLLCAIAAFGFTKWQQEVLLPCQSFSDSNKQAAEEGFSAFMKNYLAFAEKYPDLYDLMFGQPIWKAQVSNDLLKETAFPAFEAQRNLVEKWQNCGLLNNSINSLRLSQVIWSTLHGLSRLVIDGIYLHTNDHSSVDDICINAASMFTADKAD